MSSSVKLDSVKAKLKSLLLDLSGFDLEELDQSATFLELGFDSLFLIQFSQAIKKGFKVKVSFRQLIEQIPTPTALIQHLAEKASDDVLPAAPAAQPAAPVPAPSAPQAAPSQPAPQPVPMQPIQPLQPLQNGAAFNGFSAGAATGSVEELKHLMAQQLQVMSLQLSMLTGGGSAPAAMPAAQPASQPAEEHASQDDTASDSKALMVIAPREETLKEVPKPERRRFGPYKPVKKADDGGLTEQQQAHLDEFIARYTEKTKTSKELAARHRSHFADPRGIYGFRKIWKEMVYQINTVKSKGSKLWDVDGNEYIDVAMGFGLNLFGQSPDFITDAVREQLERGVEVGPQSPLAGEVAELLCELTGQERATFCNTGSEAVMAAIRLSRLYTGKTKYVYFNGAYHGNFEQVLLRSSKIGNRIHVSPATPGIPHSLTEEAIILDYGDPASLEIIKEHADDIACILIETVQSSKPDLQPKEFLHALRKLTEENDIVYIMDEVISGFRAAPGGAQEWFGINADMTTYGKVLGGGMPIGALAGKAKYMDGLDSGSWNYGDDSVPEADLTFFAGTFVRHPLAMAAAKAVLTHVKEQGPELQKGLTARTKALVDELNAFFEERNVPIKLLQYTSLFRFAYSPDMEYIDMLYYHLLDRGIFTRGFYDNCFLSTAHTDEDIEKIKTAIKETIIALQDGGFLPELGGAPEKKSNPAPHSASSQDEGAGSQAEPLAFPLTESQSEIWIASQLGDEASSAYNEPFTAHLKGSIQLKAMHEAIQHVVSQHQTFNLRFSADGSEQYVVPHTPVEIAKDDLSKLKDAEQEQALNKIKAHYASTPFNLKEGNLLRVHIIRLKEDEHVIAFSANHLICDGWSWSVLLEEISENYNNLISGKELIVEERPLFSEYVAYSMEQQEDEDMDESYAYWKEVFSPLPATLELPLDNPRPSFKSFKGATYTYQFHDDVYQAAKKIASEQNISLFTLLFGTFNILMARLSGQDDIVVAIPSAGQLQFGEDKLVGHCVNLLPIRSVVEGSQSSVQFFKQTATLVLDSYEHQACTLGGILKQLTIPRDPSRSPLAEVQFNLDRDGVGLDFEGLECQLAQSPKTAVVFDLFFNLNEMENGFYLDLDYNADLFDAATIQRWVHHYESLLLGLADDAEQSIAKLPLSRQDEETEYQSAYTDTIQAYPSESTVDQLFQAQASQTPDTIALEFEGTRLTYKQLDQYSNQFARYMTKLNVGPNVLVGVHMERSAGMLVALLGILKAGGAYVPIDPTYPSSRIQHMVDDSGMEIFLSERALLDSMEDISFPETVTVISLDDERENINSHSNKKLKQYAAPENLAYVIYTSGSTGLPKGVEISHQALVNFLWSMKNEPGFTQSDTLLCVTTLSFDIAGLELYLPIISGGKVVIASQEVAMDGKKLASEIESRGVTVMQATPATWRLLMETGWSGKNDLKILCGGEAMPKPLAMDLLPLGAELWNMYGPTETTIWSSIHRIQEDDSIILIGKPIANTEFYILDDYLQLVPPGSTGRLFIGGDGLARGYLNRAELTAERFIPHPFAQEEGQKLYDTGDLARMHANGYVECIGRNDSQVKVRGFRIELGEIESVLMDHDSVTKATVIVIGDQQEEKKLAAYYELKAGVNQSVSELRTFLRAHLPEYMVPSFFIQMEAMPLTPNGKIDRKGLPAPDSQLTQSDHPYVAPRTPTEQMIADVWSEVLHLDKIGIHDNFFDLGGHSLQATRVITRLSQPAHIDIPLRTFFEHPTVEELAIEITQLQVQEENDQDIMQMIEELEDLSDEEISALLRDSE